MKFFKCNKDTDDTLNPKLTMTYFERKIENYKRRDRKAKQEVPEQVYVNAERLLNNITSTVTNM